MKDPYRNYLHLEPQKGLLNDPNGVSYFNGKYYVYHQWNRFACDHSYKEWGLFTSKDLLHWENVGSALVPDSLEDRSGVYSGSAVVTTTGLHLFYTGNTKGAGHRKSFQKQALTTDGQSYLKYPGLATPGDLTEHHRDPKVLKVGPFWWMLVGSQTKAHQGAVALYRSLDLKQWDYRGLLFTAKELDQMCECPDLLFFAEQAILLVCPQKRELSTDTALSSYAGYYIGKLAGEKFQAVTKLRLLDHGFDFYAPQTFKDPKGRYLLWAWMSRMDAQAERTCPTKAFGYLHCLTLPRVLTFEQGKLYQRPPKEYLAACQLEEMTKAEHFELPCGNGVKVLELTLLKKASSFKLALAGGVVRLKYAEQKLTLIRQSWNAQAVQTKELALANLEKLQLFIDRSALEIFVNDGAYVMSLRYFVAKAEFKLEVTCPNEHVCKYYALKL